jgi:hypothetical protein
LERDALITGVVIDGAEAEGNSGGLYLSGDGGHAELRDVEIRNAKAGTGAGAAAISGYDTILLDQARFINCDSVKSNTGGELGQSRIARLIPRDAARDNAVTVRDSSFTHDGGYAALAGQDPGNYFVSQGKARFQRCSFNNLRRGAGTGELHLFRSYGSLTLEDCEFNLAPGVGLVRMARHAEYSPSPPSLDLNNSRIGGYAYQAGRPLIRLDGSGTWRLRANSTYNGSPLTTTLINQLVTQGAIVKLNGAAISQ